LTLDTLNAQGASAVKRNRTDRGEYRLLEISHALAGGCAGHDILKKLIKFDPGTTGPPSA